MSEQMTAEFLRGRLFQFDRMKKERPVDPCYWDMHERESIQHEFLATPASTVPESPTPGLGTCGNICGQPGHLGNKEPHVRNAACWNWRPDAATSAVSPDFLSKKMDVVLERVDSAMTLLCDAQNALAMSKYRAEPAPVPAEPSRCPHCDSDKKNVLGKECQYKPFQPINFRQEHPWHSPAAPPAARSQGLDDPEMWRGIGDIPTGGEPASWEQKVQTSASSGAGDTTPPLRNEPVGAAPPTGESALERLRDKHPFVEVQAAECGHDHVDTEQLCALMAAYAASQRASLERQVEQEHDRAEGSNEAVVNYKLRLETAEGQLREAREELGALSRTLKEGSISQAEVLVNRIVASLGEGRKLEGGGK